MDFIGTGQDIRFHLSLTQTILNCRHIPDKPDIAGVIVLLLHFRRRGRKERDLKNSDNLP